MTLEELIGKYIRLRAELSGAYAALSSDARHIDRLDDEMTATCKAITDGQPLDEQTTEILPLLLGSPQECEI